MSVPRIFSCAALVVLFAGCSDQAMKLSVARTAMIDFKVDSVTLRSADAIPANFGEQKDSILRIGDPSVKFQTKVSLRANVLGKKDGVMPLVRVRVQDAAGKILEETQRQGEILDWDIVLRAGDGAYNLCIDVVNSKDVGGDVASTQVMRFLLDTAAPLLATRSVLTASENNSERFFKFDMRVTDSSDVVCRATVVPGVAVDVAPIELELLAGYVKDGLREYAAARFSLPEGFPSAIIVNASCTDVHKRAGEISEASAYAQPMFNVQVTSSATKAIPLEDRSTADATERIMLRTGTGVGGVSTALPLSFKLIDKTTLQEAVASVLARERSKLQIYLTDFEIRDIADTNVGTDATRHIYLRKLFDSQMSAAIPSSILGKQRLFASTTQIREKDGSEVLLGSVPLDVYVQENGTAFSFEWLSGAQYVPAILNAAISLRVKISSASGKGAPLLGAPQIQYTFDNSVWNNMPAGSVSSWKSVEGRQDEYSFLVNYPFAEEKSFRVRVFAKDSAGNESASDYSRNLVGVPELSVTATQCAPGNRGVAIRKASSFLCRKEVAGNARFFVPVVAIATGDSPLNIVSNSLTCSFASGECFPVSFSSGTNTTTEKLDGLPFVAEDFNNGKSTILHVGSFVAGDVAKAANMSVSYGELAGFGPTCVAAPATIVALKSSTTTLAESPYRCE
jgi:hypothetical protein